ncbi:MAG: hypothetical protein FWD68_03280 [Alphaproteobacteria bacterium]|nr:hypothetical protein [Alphaproteobacteria bacterium]
MAGVTGDDDEFMRDANACDYRIRHTGTGARREHLRFQPPANGAALLASSNLPEIVPVHPRNPS